MRLAFLLVLLIALTGCRSPERIDREALDRLYQSTQLADGTRSIVPMRLEPNVQPPVVVNWWYAGTSSGLHEIVYRDLTWDADGKPVGHERRYRIASDQLRVEAAFDVSGDSSRWVPLHEAASGEIEPPADLPTARQAPTPIETNPIRQPDELITPKPD